VQNYVNAQEYASDITPIFTQGYNRSKAKAADQSWGALPPSVTDGVACAPAAQMLTAPTSVCTNVVKCC